MTQNKFPDKGVRMVTSWKMECFQELAFMVHSRAILLSEFVACIISNSSFFFHTNPTSDAWVWHGMIYVCTELIVVNNGLFTRHDDVIKWKHFPRYWPFVRGIHRSRWIPAQRPVTRSFDVYFDLRPN